LIVAFGGFSWLFWPRILALSWRLFKIYLHHPVLVVAQAINKNFLAINQNLRTTKSRTQGPAF
jgi:hypothetical protein